MHGYKCSFCTLLLLKRNTSEPLKNSVPEPFTAVSTSNVGDDQSDRPAFKPNNDAGDCSSTPLSATDEAVVEAVGQRESQESDLKNISADLRSQSVSHSSLMSFHMDPLRGDEYAPSSDDLDDHVDVEMDRAIWTKDDQEIVAQSADAASDSNYNKRVLRSSLDALSSDDSDVHSDDDSARPNYKEFSSQKSALEQEHSEDDDDDAASTMSIESTKSNRNALQSSPMDIDEATPNPVNSENADSSTVSEHSNIPPAISAMIDLSDDHDVVPRKRKLPESMQSVMDLSDDLSVPEPKRKRSNPPNEEPLDLSICDTPHWKEAVQRYKPYDLNTVKKPFKRVAEWRQGRMYLCYCQFTAIYTYKYCVFADVSNNT